MRNCTLVLLFNDQNQILLCMKKRGFGVGKWNGPGGKVDEGESLLQSALRELQEETGIALTESQLSPRGVLHFFFENKPERDHPAYLFVGRYNGEFVETDEMKPQWWNIDEIPYHAMWEDDIIWLPRVIAGESVEYKFFFDKEQKYKSEEEIG